MVETKSIVFPGRFQPISIAHVERIKWVLYHFPLATITIIIGETGTLNRQNFLTASERITVFNAVFGMTPFSRIRTVVVRGCKDGDEWATRVISAVPDADSVASDNPFVYEPLCRAGLRYIQYVRSGVSCSAFRNLPVTHWAAFIPEVELSFFMKWKIKERISNLPDGCRYPFN